MAVKLEVIIYTNEKGATLTRITGSYRRMALPKGSFRWQQDYMMLSRKRLEMTITA